MLAFSSVEVKANDSSSSTTPETITQEYSVNNSLSIYEFRSKVISIMAEAFELDRSFLEDHSREYTFYYLGLDSLDWIELNFRLEEEFNIELKDYSYNYPMWMESTIYDFTTEIWKRKYINRW